MKKAQRKADKTGKQTSKKRSRPGAKKLAKSAPKARPRASAGPSRARARAVPAGPGRDVSGHLNALQARLRNLEDIMEISRLKAAYCEAVDGGWDRRTHRGEEVAALFVDDGVWDAGKVGGRGEGRQGIVEKIDSFTQMPFALHRVTNPDIRVNGDEAVGKWHVIAYLSQPDGTPVMFMGVYRDKFVRTLQGWKFKHLGGAAAYFASLREGWGVGEHYKQRAPSESEAAPQAH
ncbi:MAG TPA: nuclear transport factor 2 family protein [Candidatus Binataceae bacterium]